MSLKKMAKKANPNELNAIRNAETIQIFLGSILSASGESMGVPANIPPKNIPKIKPDSSFVSLHNFSKSGCKAGKFA